MRHEHNDSGKRFALGFFAGALAAAATMGYLFFGSKHKYRNRAVVDRWVTDAKAEILEKMERAGEMSEEQYRRIVDEVTKRYGKLKEIGSERAEEAAEYLKDQWEDMRGKVQRAKERAEKERGRERGE